MCKVEAQPGCQFKLTFDHLTFNGLVALRDSLRKARPGTEPAKDVVGMMLAELDRALGQN